MEYLSKRHKNRLAELGTNRQTQAKKTGKQIDRYEQGDRETNRQTDWLSQCVCVVCPLVTLEGQTVIHRQTDRKADRRIYL
jgi:hypothetical protein